MQPTGSQTLAELYADLTLYNTEGLPSTPLVASTALQPQPKNSGVLNL